MKQKYTIEEFKEMYDKAMKKALDKMDKEMKETQEKNGKEDGMASALFSMQNMMAMIELKQCLFKED